MRFHYLASIALVNIGLVLCLTNSFEGSIRQLWLPLTALPYFALYGRDLKLLGYRWRDLFGVYALNLLLVPVNLGGVLRSLYQMITGAKSAFRRTPKIADRTTTAPVYLILELVLFLHCAVGGVIELRDGHLSHGTFALVNAFIWGFGIVAFIGLREGAADLRAWLAPARAQVVPSARPRTISVPAFVSIAAERSARVLAMTNEVAGALVAQVRDRDHSSGVVTLASAR